ncbi:hypothetical protein GCM10027040_12390 [Halomonas shantousis]
MFTLMASLIGPAFLTLVSSQSLASDIDSEVLSALQDRSVTMEKGSNTATIHQSGSYNQARIRQAAAGIGYGNTASIYQVGNDNRGEITQQGNDNYGDITQLGDAHEASISQSGNGLAASVKQSGRGGSQIRLYQTPAQGVRWSSTNSTASVAVRTAQ